MMDPDMVELRQWALEALIGKGILDDSLIPFAAQLVEFVLKGKVPDAPPVEDPEFETKAFAGEEEEEDDDTWLERAKRAAAED